MGTKKALTFKQQIKAINDASSDTHLTSSERNLYKWLSTQEKHKHMFIFKKFWWQQVLFRIDQKHKR